LGGVGEERTVLPFPPFDGEPVAEVESFAFVLTGEGLLFNCFVCSSGELGSGLKVLLPVPLAEGLGELDSLVPFWSVRRVFLVTSFSLTRVCRTV